MTIPINKTIPKHIADRTDGIEDPRKQNTNLTRFIGFSNAPKTLGW